MRRPGNINQIINMMSKMPKAQQKLSDIIDRIENTRIANYEELKRWEQQRKVAYRNQLDNEVNEHRKIKQQIRGHKASQRREIQYLAESEKRRNNETKNYKVKTEQKYMMDNYRMINSSMKEERTPKPEANSSFKEHPFIRLVEGQDRRNAQTKRHFMYQNHLNDIQSQMKKEFLEKKKKNQREERIIFQNHVEEQFQKKSSERIAFEKKYLKLNVRKGDNQKSQYLQFLKEQAAETRRSRLRQVQQPQIQNLTSVSPGNLGLLPMSLDRQKQLIKIDNSLKLRHSENSPVNTSLQIRRQPSPSGKNHDKFHTQAIAKDNYLPAPNIFSSISSKPIKSYSRIDSYDRVAQAQKLPNIVQKQTPASRVQRPRRQFHQFDFIQGADKTFIA